MSIHKTTNGQYKVRFRVGPKQYSKSGFTTKRDAKAWEAEQLRRVRSNTWVDPAAGRITLAELFQEWIENKRVSERTESDYHELWANCIKSELGHFKITDISPSLIAGWMSHLYARYSTRRVKKARTILNQVLDWAIANDRITHNPVHRADLILKRDGVRPSRQPRTNEFLTHDQVAALAKACGPYQDMILVMAYTGLRFGEVTALQFQDIDFLRGRILVSRAWTDVRGRLVEVTPKSGRSREVPIPTEIRRILEKRMAGDISPEDLVFTTSAGSPVRYSRWRKDHFIPAVSSIGLEGFRPHGLRHTYAALAVQAGANPKVLQAAMGHSDIRLTLDTYGGLFDDDLESLAKGLDKRLRFELLAQ